MVLKKQDWTPDDVQGRNGAQHGKKITAFNFGEVGENPS
jgi:hypothetical protein